MCQVGGSVGLVFLLLYFPKDVGFIIGLNQSVEFFLS